jgi:hypothetical protein
MLQMQALMTGFLGPKENLIPSAEVSPSKATAKIPLISFVPENGKPNDEEIVGDTGTPT